MNQIPETAEETDPWAQHTVNCHMHRWKQILNHIPGGAAGGQGMGPIGGGAIGSDRDVGIPRGGVTAARVALQEAIQWKEKGLILL